MREYSITVRGAQSELVPEEYWSIGVNYDSEFVWLDRPDKANIKLPYYYIITFCKD